MRSLFHETFADVGMVEVGHFVHNANIAWELSPISHFLTEYCHTCQSTMQLIPLPSNAQAKIGDMSRMLLNHVSQMPMNMPLKQVKCIQATFLV